MREKFKVLIVDDDESTRKICREILKGNPGLRIEEAKDGKEAIKKTERSVPDIVLCTLQMPDMEGIEFCRSIKCDPCSDLANTYIIVVGPKEGHKEKIRCIEEGADDFIAKPVIPDELLARIKVAQKVSLNMKKTELDTKALFHEMDVLLIQEGGCAPGYNPFTAFVTFHLEIQARKVYATREGFRSLVSGKDDDFLRLVYDPGLFKQLDRIPGVFHAAPLSEWRGARLRAERYREFIKRRKERQRG